jgi:hypothetical protein
MDPETSAVHGRTGIIVVVIVILGIGVLGAGGYLAWSKRRGAEAGASGASGSADLVKWCELRQEWARKVNPMVGDIMLKAVKDEDRAEHDQLVLKRNKLSAEYAGKLRSFLSSPHDLGDAEQALIKKAEEALVKEGKVRANVAVEIHNLAAKELGSDESSVIGKARDTLRTAIVQRMQEARQTADAELKAALASVPSTACPNLYRGPSTEEGTADSPYVSWDELELKRTTALAKFEAKLKTLEPLEEFTNRVYHELVRQYRGLLTSCHAKAKAASAGLPDRLGLLVRLKKSGEVKSLAIQWPEDKRTVLDPFLNCLLEKAAKWKLPRPDEKTSVVVVTLDFTRI